MDSLDKGFSALARSDVLESDVDSLGDNSVSDQFVHDHTDGSGIHVENFSSSSLVIFEWHSLINFYFYVLWKIEKKEKLTNI